MQASVTIVGAVWSTVVAEWVSHVAAAIASIVLSLYRSAAVAMDALVAMVLLLLLVRIEACRSAC